ncbi:MAG TPA: DUF4388 domain-containing protein [Candidatus Udaeobacter sp.]|jgi:hypothetical protein|nr:DUF4388 domain-containing protein [Candidatus Udaeobacter sp.]
MALQGNLRDFAATEILQLLGTQKKTGCLTLEWNTERAVVYVQEGRIISTRRPGMAQDDPLLRFLLKVHRLSKEQHRGILTLQRESNRDLEDLLLNGRYLDQEELAAYVERQILDDLMRITRWENGAYRFDPSHRWNNPPLVRLNIEGAMIEAARRVDEQRRFVSVFKDPHQLLGVLDLPDPTEPLSDEERELFGIIDGQHTVAEVVEAAPLSEYEAYESLFRMLDQRWLEFVGRRDPGVSASPTGPAKAVHPRDKVRPLNELAVAAIVLASFAGLRFGSGLLPHAAATAPERDPFIVSQVRDLRFALELYRRERGSYPEKLSDLVEDRWIDPAQARVGGGVEYRRDPGGLDYRLNLPKSR